MLRGTLIRLSQQPRLKAVASHNGLARRMATRFVAGETLDDAIDAVRRLNARGLTATLDHLGENTTSRAQADADSEAGCTIMRTIARHRLQCNASFKLSQLGLDLGEDLAYANMERIVQRAVEFDNFVRIDMESSEYVDRTLRIFYRLFHQYHGVGAVIQSALYRSESDVEHLIEAGARVRLVKGAYLEPPKVAFPRKEDVDRNFVRLMRLLLARGVYPAIATHDVAMIDATKRFAHDNGIDRSRFEFQMLYGVRRDLQEQLRGQGYNVRIYVPYGTSWYPYLMRRMAERPANVMFVLGNIAREAAANRRG
jgi:proline dehydrogenase